MKTLQQLGDEMEELLDAKHPFEKCQVCNRLVPETFTVHINEGSRSPDDVVPVEACRKCAVEELGVDGEELA